MRTCTLAFAAATAVALLAAPGANAKGFEPGDLRICNATRCKPVMYRPAVEALGAFYYADPRPPALAARPPLGAPAFELRFDNGYVTGIVAAAARLDRFLSYGVNLGRFEAGWWYRLPRPAGRQLRRLMDGLVPLRLTRAALARSR
jgi:hypothetical protein